MRKRRHFPTHQQKKGNTFLWRCFVFFLLNVALLSYIFALSYPSIQEIIEYKSHVVFLCALSILSIFLAVNVTIFTNKIGSTSSRVMFILLSIIYLTIIFFYDQNTTEEEFKYGYWASRGYLYIFVGLQSLFLFLIWIVNLFCVRLRLPRLTAVFVALFFIVFLLRMLLLYSFRTTEFKKGSFKGQIYDPELSKCHIDTDTFLGSRLYPRFFFQKVLMTYWCDKHPEFIKVKQTDSFDDDTVEIEILCKSHESAKIEMLKSVTESHYTYEEMRAPGDPGQFPVTNLQTSILNKMKSVHLPPEQKTFSYSSSLYETIKVTCEDQQFGNLVVEPRKKIKDSELLDLSFENPNLIVLFFDSESRKSFQFNFPETLTWLNRKYFDSSAFHVTEYFSHHVVGWNTLPQTLAMFNGYLREYEGEMKYDEPWEVDGVKNKKFNSGVHNTPIWKLIQQKTQKKKQKYLTVFSTDDCNEWSTMYNRNQQLTDYIHLEPFCFPEFTDPERPIQSFKGSFSASRKCLFQKEGPEYVFDYFRKIDRLYPKKAKFMLGMFLDGHEATGESGRYVDPYLLDYLRYLAQSKEQLEKTIIFMFGDHGNHMSILSNLFYKEGDVGGRNPALITFVPKKYMQKRFPHEKEEETKNRIWKNQNRLVTAFDLHKTWSNILGLQDKDISWNKKGLDLLRDLVPFERSCEDAGIPYGTLCKKLLCDNKKEKNEK